MKCLGLIIRQIFFEIQVQSIIKYFTFSKTKSIWVDKLLSNFSLINFVISFIDFDFWLDNCLLEYHSFIHSLNIVSHLIFGYLLFFFTKQKLHSLHLYFCLFWLFLPFFFINKLLHFGHFFLHKIKLFNNVSFLLYYFSNLKQI